MKYENDDNKIKRKLKHAPNRLGEGMRILNEHDADTANEIEEDEVIKDFFEKDETDPELLEKYLKK